MDSADTMATFKELVDRDCGGANPIMKLTSHVTHDRAFKQEGLRQTGLPLHDVPFELATDDQLVNEFLGTQHHFQNGLTTFRMDALLREMQEIEGTRGGLLQAPEVVNLAADWTEEYLEPSHDHLHPKNTNAQEPHMQWASEFLQHTDPSDARESLWARDYLEQNEHKLWSEEFGNEQGVDIKSESAEDLPRDSHQSLVDEWAKEFDLKEGGEESYWDLLGKEWGMAQNVEDSVGAELDNPKYTFEEDNPLCDHPDPFAEGLKRLKLGDITNAVLLFEAAVQKDSNNSEAWQYLGTTQASNEQDLHALNALRSCIKLDPNNLTALMALAVSYLNESLQFQAHNALLQWLKRNPKYSHLVPQDMAVTTDLWFNSIYTELRDLYIKAVQIETKEIDADVQVGLGVLFNLSMEYDKAVDCFTAALQVRPDDSMLWNKLGASLANGRRCEEAVGAYHHALNISPGYVRTRYNLGIACVNLGAYQEAIEHFLIALNLQKNNRGPKDEKSAMSTSIWMSLQMAVSLLGRTDLSADLNSRDLNALNKKFNITV